MSRTQSLAVMLAKDVATVLVMFACLVPLLIAEQQVGTDPDTVTASQPYGGCKEAAAYPHSRGARDCRRHGWTVTRRIVVGPRGIVRFNTLPPCQYEDGRSCVWNAHTSGNGVGHSFWSDSHDRVHYVRGFAAGVTS